MKTQHWGSAIICLMLLAGSTSKSLATTAADDIRVDEAVIREMPPGAPATAAFMKIINNSKKDHTLTAAKSSISNAVELHDHVLTNGVMQMRPVEKISLKAGETTHLKPGSLHIMFIGVTNAPKADQKVPVTLVFEDSSTKVVEIPVRKMEMDSGGAQSQKMPQGMNHGMHHGTHHDDGIDKKKK